MATRVLVMLLVTLLVVTLPDSTSVSPTLSQSQLAESSILATGSPVFEAGKYDPVSRKVSTCSPPRSLFIVWPKEQGRYPVILFHHGTSCQNTWYTDVLKFISSHGYIVVAPQYYQLFPPSAQQEIDLAAAVANWLPSGLPCVLPENIEGDLRNLALSGHSRGGYIAFALALGYAKVSLKVNVSALIGVDPVAGTSKADQLVPHVLKYQPCDFNLPNPVAVIGSGLGNESAFIFPPQACAPNGVSHTEFFNECRPPCSHFVTTKYGHMDILDDDIGPIGNTMRLMCKGCRWGLSRDPLRRTVGGIVVSFLKAYFQDNFTDYNKILQHPNSYAPTTLDPVQNKSSTASCHSHHSTVTVKPAIRAYI